MRIPDFLAAVPPRREETRVRVFCSLIEAATDATCNFMHLYVATRDARELLPDGDTGRDAPIALRHPGDAPNEHDDAARALAVLILEGKQDLPSLDDLLQWLTQDLPAVTAVPVDGLSPATLRQLAELGIRQLHSMTEVASRGWPAYVSPWNHGTREREVLVLIGKAREAAQRSLDAEPITMSIAALVALQCYWSNQGWSDKTLMKVSELADDPGIPMYPCLLPTSSGPWRRCPGEPPPRGGR